MRMDDEMQKSTGISQTKGFPPLWRNLWKAPEGKRPLFIGKINV